MVSCRSIDDDTDTVIATANGTYSAQHALEEMEEAEAAEQEVEELEDLLDYYLQRAASTQTEAERLLAGARDLEESIGVSLSARRFEVGAELMSITRILSGRQLHGSLYHFSTCVARFCSFICAAEMYISVCVRVFVLHLSTSHCSKAFCVAGTGQVNRLELALSIGSFAAAIGAVVAGIFGMNLKSTLEESIIGFWGTTAAILLGCVCVFLAIFQHTRRRRIL